MDPLHSFDFGTLFGKYVQMQWNVIDYDDKQLFHQKNVLD